MSCMPIGAASSPFGQCAGGYEIINHRAESYGKHVIIDIQASESITKDDVRIVPTYI